MKNDKKMKISYAAPAKVILSGEHAVVYGKPALVCAIDLRLGFTVASKPDTILKRSVQDGISNSISLIEEKVKDYLKKEKISFSERDFVFEVSSDIPIGQGLGSSAAFSVAAVAALLRFYTGKDFGREVVNSLAYQVEKYFHRNPSGVDNTAACFGGLIYYRREFEFLKNISVLNFKIPKKIEENLFLIDSGKPVETTAQMVEFVGKMYNKKPSYLESILNEIEKTTKRMVVAIVKEDVNFFQQSLLDNEIFLEMMGVVSQKTKTMLKKLSPYGVGKITGAGGRKKGSGYLLFYANKKKELEEYCKKEKISYLKFKQSYEGVKQQL